MKTNQILALVGGLLLIVSTLIPLPFLGPLIQWVSMIGADFLIGLLPIVLIATGLVGALMGWKNNGTMALAMGAIAIVYMLIASRFEFRMFQATPFLLALAGGILLIAGGATTKKS